MATDATGTPTDKGIPTYDTENDAPSGLGFNAAMAVIDSLLGWAKIRKNSGGSVFSRARVNLIEGSGVTITVADDAVNDEVDVTIAAAVAGVAGYGTALPGSPADGQEFILVDSTTLPTYFWRFRFNAGSSNALKWEFIGGAPARVTVATPETTASSSYVALATSGPNFAIPVQGDYDVMASFTNDTRTTDGVSLMSYDIGATPASDDWAAGSLHWNNSPQGIERTMRHLNIAASAVIQSKYRTVNGTPSFKNRTIYVRPVRVI